MKWLSIAILTLVLFVYILVGGAIFMALEKENETSVASTQLSTFQQFITDNTCVTTDELRTFAEAVVTAYDAGITATDTTSASNWEYGPSVFFSITVVTSIGYGNISPTTDGGQIFFVFYAIIGIPLCAVLLAGIGGKMTTPYKKLEGKQFFPKHQKIEKVAKQVLFNLMFFVVFSFIPAAIFTAIEDWTYLEAWYYTIVTLTTVGFGDYVPGQTEESGSGVRAVYKLGVAVWIILGLSWLSMMLNLIGDVIKEQSSKVDKASDKPEAEGQELGEVNKTGDANR